MHHRVGGDALRVRDRRVSESARKRKKVRPPIGDLTPAPRDERAGAIDGSVQLFFTTSTMPWTLCALFESMPFSSSVSGLTWSDPSNAHRHRLILKDPHLLVDR